MWVMWVRHMTYQKAFKLLGLSDVNPAVFFNYFDVVYLIIESVKPNITEITRKNTKCLQKAWKIIQNKVSRISANKNSIGSITVTHVRV